MVCVHARLQVVIRWPFASCSPSSSVFSTMHARYNGIRTDSKTIRIRYLHKVFNDG
eukprot:jgi/Botrbrau1/9960/Bobra.0012s0055.1